MAQWSQPAILDESCANYTVYRAVLLNPRYKTELCWNMDELGKCKYASKCQFAHTGDELRPKVTHHPHYRTQLCRTYHETNYCNFGKRCAFIHEKDSGESGDPKRTPRVIFLRPNYQVAHPRYRAPACRVCRDTGVCPLGDQCKCKERKDVPPTDESGKQKGTKPRRHGNRNGRKKAEKPNRNGAKLCLHLVPGGTDGSSQSHTLAVDQWVPGETEGSGQSQKIAVNQWVPGGNEGSSQSHTIAVNKWNGPLSHSTVENTGVAESDKCCGFCRLVNSPRECICDRMCALAGMRSAATS